MELDMTYDPKTYPDEKYHAMFNNVTMSITQYDNETDEELNTYSGRFLDIMQSIENPGNYYYRLTYYGYDSSNKKVVGHHFESEVQSYGSLTFSIGEHLNRLLNSFIKDYANGSDFAHDPFLIIMRRAMDYDWLFYDLNNTNSEDFQAELQRFLDTYPVFVQVENMAELKKTKGLYLMVLDKLNTCYIGQSNNLFTRIKRHWSNSSYYDGKGIDLFKAYDTTRLYAFIMDDEQYSRVDVFENAMVKSMPKKYLRNVLAGGGIDYVLEELNEHSLEEDYLFLWKELLREGQWAIPNHKRFNLHINEIPF